MVDGGGKGYCPKRIVVGSQKKMKHVVLWIFQVSEHDNQPEIEHELLPQYVIDTGEHDGNVVSSEMIFFTTKQQSEICPHLRTGSSAEDRGRIDTRAFQQHLGFQLDPTKHSDLTH